MSEEYAYIGPSVDRFPQGAGASCVGKGCWIYERCALSDCGWNDGRIGGK